MNNANGNGGSPKPKKAPGKTGKVLNDLFNPQLGQSIRPIGENLNMFVQMIAMIFAANRLFPRNHPALLGNPNVRLSLGEVIRTAYSQLQFTREGLPQVVLFFATVGTLVFTGLLLVTLLLSAFVGTAHAQTGMFEYPNAAQDWSKGVLDYFFRPAATATTNLQIFQATAIQTALQTALSFYSTAILVCAGFILLYHLVTMIAETAHTGKPMGRANQIWAPIRLIVAIGLLVPIAGGFNSGQFIVIKMADWGSALASNTWRQFVTGLGAQRLGFSPIPPPTVSGLVGDVFIIKVCQYAYSRYQAEGMRGVTPGANAPNLTMREMPPAGAAARQTGFRIGNDTYNSITNCGTVRYAQELRNATGEAQMMASQILATQRQVFESSALTGIDRLAQDYVNDPNSFTDARFANVINAYQTQLRTTFQNIQNTPTTTNISAALQESTNQGWMSAGAYFSDLARRQGALFDAALALPTITTPNLPRQGPTDQLIAQSVCGDGARILGNANCRSRQGAVQAARGQGNASDTVEFRTFTFIESAKNKVNQAIATYRQNNPIVTGQALVRLEDIEVAANQQASNRLNWVNWLLDGLNWALGFAGIGWSGGPNEVTAFKFNATANPLAEIVTFGQKKINAAMIVIGTGAVVAGAVGISLGGGAGTLVATFVGFFATILLVAGITLAFVIPILAFIKFFFNIITWILAVLEAVVAIPILALAHLNPYGDGYVGNAKQGYTFIFNLFLRPVLMVLGLIVALVLFIIGIALLNTGYETAVARSVGFGGGYAFFTKVVYSVIYAVLAYVCANKCFKAIDLFPTQAMAWMGASGQRMEAMGDSKIMGDATGLAGTYMINQASQALPKVTGQLGGQGHDANSEDGKEQGKLDGLAGRSKNPGLKRFLPGFTKGYDSGHEAGSTARRGNLISERTATAGERVADAAERTANASESVDRKTP